MAYFLSRGEAAYFLSRPKELAPNDVPDRVYVQTTDRVQAFCIRYAGAKLVLENVQSGLDPLEVLRQKLPSSFIVLSSAFSDYVTRRVTVA